MLYSVSRVRKQDVQSREITGLISSAWAFSEAVDETTEGLFSLNIMLPSNQNSPRRDHFKTKINLIPLALCFVQNRRMCEAGFIKILQMAVSNLAVQKCFNNLATKKKNLISCKGEEEKAQLVHAEAEMGV